MAKHFLRKHGKELSQRPFWVFSSGPIGDRSHDNPSWEEPRRIVEKAEALGVREHVIFGGRVPSDPHGPGQRAMVENTPPEYRDRRDWDEIRAWASRICGAGRSCAQRVASDAGDAPFAGSSQAGVSQA